jgi:methyl-accepting chemotaxis protein
MNIENLIELISPAALLIIFSAGITVLFRKKIRNSILLQILKISIIPILIAVSIAVTLGRFGTTLFHNLLASILILGCFFYSFWMIKKKIVTPLQRYSNLIKQVSENDLPNIVQNLKLIADGDFSRAIKPVTICEQNVIGNYQILDIGQGCYKIFLQMEEMNSTIEGMLYNFQTTLSQIQSEITGLVESTAQFASTLSETSCMADQISETISQISSGTLQQAQSAETTSVATMRLKESIHNVAVGTREQFSVIQTSTEETNQLTAVLQEVANKVEFGVEKAEEMASISQKGAATVDANLKSIQNINTTFTTASENVGEMRRLSAEIGSIVNTIDEIASQTNLLALNAAIEAARTSGNAVNISQSMLQNHLSSFVVLFSELLKKIDTPLTDYELIEIGKACKIEEILLTDGDGVVIATNHPSDIAFRFSDDPKDQSYQFRHLLYQDDGLYAQDIQPRSIDGQLYMYVGASRKDEPGMVQVGVLADEVQKHALQGRGFAVVANEVRKLAGESASAAKEIAKMITNVQKAIENTALAMKSSGLEIENGVSTAQQSEKDLNEILNAAQELKNLLTHIAGGAKTLTLNANNLLDVISTVSLVAQENSDATQQMTAASQEAAAAIENIASISEQTSASAEEINASTVDMAEHLHLMLGSAEAIRCTSDRLKNAVDHFKTKI